MPNMRSHWDALQKTWAETALEDNMSGPHKPTNIKKFMSKAEEPVRKVWDMPPHKIVQDFIDQQKKQKEHREGQAILKSVSDTQDTALALPCHKCGEAVLPSEMSLGERITCQRCKDIQSKKDQIQHELMCRRLRKGP
jgi:hypothetical protein